MRQKIGKILMVLGALLILASIGLMAYNRWDSDRAERASQEALGKLEENLNETLAETAENNEAASEPEAPQPELDPEQEMTAVEIDGWNYIGYLSIPAVELELPVMSQWSYAGLKIAPGRYSGSTYADNMVVCAHNYAKHFSPIKWLSVGSEVIFTDMDGLRWEYEVVSVETVQPTQIDRMINASAEDDWDLTLFTCTTGGNARCAVRCVRTAYPTAAVQAGA